MRHLTLAFMLLVTTGAWGMDRHKIDVDPESQDGILLQRIQQEPTQPRKLALLEKFAAQYPKATSIAWVYEQLLPIYWETQQYDKLLETADSLLAVDPLDLDSAHYALKIAEARNDPGLIGKYALSSWDIGVKVAQFRKPSDPDDQARWSKQIEFAKQVMTYAEYLVSQQIAQEQDQQKKAALIQELEKRNPQSQYLAVVKAAPVRTEVIPMDSDRGFSMALRGISQDPDNPDYLMTIAENYLRKEEDLQRVLNYSLRLLDVAPKRQKPDGLSSDEWEKKKAQYTGAGNWMAGIVYGKQARYGLSDRHLRSALPYIKDNAQALAAAYFYLGYDNYAMAGEQHDKGLAVEAVRFSKLCLSIDGPFQSLAQKNLEALRTDYNVE